MLLSSCGSPTHEETVMSARAAIEAGNYQLAAKSIDAAVKDLDNETPSVSELSELAMLKMMIADLDSEAADASEALDLYQRACEISSDSVELYMLSLPRDEAQYLVMLRNLQRARIVSATGDFPQEEAGEAEETSQIVAD